MIRGEAQGNDFGPDTPGPSAEGHAYLDRTDKPLWSIGRRRPLDP
jgi:hypothetical protein